MYCSSCGATVAPELNYCKRCGARLKSEDNENPSIRSSTFPDSLIWAIVGIFIGGTGVTIGLLAVMKNLLNFNDGLLAFFAMACFVMIFAIEASFLRLLFSHLSNRRNSTAGLAFKLGSKKEQTPALPEPTTTELEDSIINPNITEHTTRTLEPVHRERNKI